MQKQSEVKLGFGDDLLKEYIESTKSISAPSKNDDTKSISSPLDMESKTEEKEPNIILVDKNTVILVL